MSRMKKCTYLDGLGLVLTLRFGCCRDQKERQCHLKIVQEFVKVDPTFNQLLGGLADEPKAKKFFIKEVRRIYATFPDLYSHIFVCISLPPPETPAQPTAVA
jgi:hypothetical protein